VQGSATATTAEPLQPLQLDPGPGLTFREKEAWPMPTSQDGCGSIMDIMDIMDIMEHLGV